MLLPSNDQPSLYDERPLDSLKIVARARTLTVLPRLDAGRKAYVVQFLYESGLITEDRIIVDLWGANLSGADLFGDDLRGAYLQGARLIRARLLGAILSEANLFGAILRGRGANLSGADLFGADLRRADLREADLGGANLFGADLRRADLRGAEGERGLYEQAVKSLKRATMPNGQKYEDWLKSKDRGEAE